MMFEKDTQWNGVFNPLVIKKSPHHIQHTLVGNIGLAQDYSFEKTEEASG